MRKYSNNNDEQSAERAGNIVEFTNNTFEIKSDKNKLKISFSDDEKNTDDKNYTGNIVELKRNKPEPPYTASILEINNNDSEQENEATSNITEFNIDEKDTEQHNNVVEFKSNIEKQKTNHISSISWLKNSGDKQKTSHTSNTAKFKNSSSKKNTRSSNDTATLTISNSDENKINSTISTNELKSDNDNQMINSITTNQVKSTNDELKSSSDSQTTNSISTTNQVKSTNDELKSCSDNQMINSITTNQVESSSDEINTNSTISTDEPKSSSDENKAHSTGSGKKKSSHTKNRHHTKTSHSSHTAESKSDNDEQKDKNSNAVNEVTDNSAGTNRHIKKRYSFSIDKEDSYIPVAVYSKRKEPKKDTVTTKKPKKKKKPIFKVFMGIAATIISLLLVISITLTVLVSTGRKSLTNNNENTKVTTPENATVEGEYVIYDGKKYKYNNKVTTILFSGIDKHTDEHNEEVLGAAGQADSIFVMALNTETGKYKLIAVSRDTMVDVNIVDVNGNFQETKKMQLCLAHAYGDGKEISNENLKASVSRVFFGIPVNSYISIDIDAIYALNDAVGGVNVNVIEDLSHSDPALVKGANVTLTGRQAEIYVRTRDVRGDANQNNLRMERQLSYVTAFINQSIAMTKSDIKTPINLFNEITPYTRTDIAPNEITYLASAFLNSSFSVEENYIKVPGETVAGEKYAEYYTDTDEFFKIILDTYYTRVE